MTTIAYRNGILAADTLVLDGNDIVCGHATKIHRTPAGDLIGAAGVFEHLPLIFDWADRGFPDERNIELKSITAIIIRKNGDVGWAWNRGFYCHAANAPFYSEGSGRELAKGAMAMGASAIEAVRVAIEYDSTSGGEIEFVALHDDQQRLQRLKP